MTDQTTIDMNYRPSSYWPESANREQRLSRIQGKTRRDIIRRALEYDGVAGLNWIGPEIVKESLSEEERQVWGRMHPSHMGGEFLPRYQESDVEIARISLKSTTADQISVRARGHDGDISYRIVDEYETDYELPITTSREPLTLAEMITLLDETDNSFNGAGGGLVRNHWFFNVEFMEPEECVDFISVGSAFYPDLGLYYEEEAEVWLAEQEVGEEEPPFLYRHSELEQGADSDGS